MNNEKKIMKEIENILSFLNMPFPEKNRLEQYVWETDKASFCVTIHKYKKGVGHVPFIWDNIDCIRYTFSFKNSYSRIDGKIVIDEGLDKLQKHVIESLVKEMV